MTISDGIKKGQKITFRHEIDNHITDDKYHLNIAVKDSKKDELIYKKVRAEEFLVRGWKVKHSLVQSPNQLRVNKE